MFKVKEEREKRKEGRGKVIKQEKGGKGWTKEKPLKAEELDSILRKKVPRKRRSDLLLLLLCSSSTLTYLSQVRSMANNVEILIPVPADADSPKFKASMGTVAYGKKIQRNFRLS